MAVIMLMIMIMVIILLFFIKDTKVYVLVVTLSAGDNQKLSKFLSKEFERSVYCNEYKTKNENKITANEYRILSNQIFLESTDLLF